MSNNIFERHKILTISSLILISLVTVIALTELALEKFMGLGNPILYDFSPIYGYRPLPNKTYKRFWGAQIKFNNLGLRADEDWDENKNNKILFLGDSVTYGGSNISNQELFSYLSIKNFEGWKSGNAGVSGWGVDNICGLIIESNFIPAKYYVSTLIEEDFYRGFSRIQIGHFFNISPKYALWELILFSCWKINNYRYFPLEISITPKQKYIISEKAMKKFKEMDLFLKEKGFYHIIFISPLKNQVKGIEDRDYRISMLFEQYGLKPIYILDKLKEKNISVDNIFYDSKHLKKEGHEIWGSIIKEETKKLLE